VRVVTTISHQAWLNAELMGSPELLSYRVPGASFQSFTLHRRLGRPPPNSLKMNAAERLHFEFLGEPFLFANLRIDSFGPFVAAASFIAAICFSER